MDTISGFTDSGFDFQDLTKSVGSNLTQWATQALNRQIGLDTLERPPVQVPSTATGGLSTVDSVKNLVKKYWWIPATIAVVGAAWYFLKGRK